MKKRLLAWIIVLAMTVTMCEVPVMAADATSDLPEKTAAADDVQETADNVSADEAKANEDNKTTESVKKKNITAAKSTLAQAKEAVEIPGVYFEFDESSYKYVAYISEEAMGVITIPEKYAEEGVGFGVEWDVVGIEMYDDNTRITQLNVPKTVNSIETTDNFSNCPSLKKIVVDAANEMYESDSDGVLYSKNKEQLIRYPIACSTTSYTIPSTAKEIYGMAFASAKNLNSVAFAGSMVEIPSETFSGCVNLTSVTFPTRMLRIGNEVFKNCTKLKMPKLPELLTEISDNAFLGCTFTEITIPKNVNYIGDYALGYKSDDPSVKVTGFKMKGYTSDAKDYADANGFSYTALEKTEEDWAEGQFGIQYSDISSVKRGENQTYTVTITNQAATTANNIPISLDSDDFDTACQMKENENLFIDNLSPTRGYILQLEPLCSVTISVEVLVDATYYRETGRLSTEVGEDAVHKTIDVIGECSIVTNDNIQITMNGIEEKRYDKEAVLDIVATIKNNGTKEIGRVDLEAPRMTNSKGGVILETCYETKAALDCEDEDEAEDAVIDRIEKLGAGQSKTVYMRFSLSDIYAGNAAESLAQATFNFSVKTMEEQYNSEWDDYEWETTGYQTALINVQIDNLNRATISFEGLEDQDGNKVGIRGEDKDVSIVVKNISEDNRSYSNVDVTLTNGCTWNSTEDDQAAAENVLTTILPGPAYTIEGADASNQCTIASLAPGQSVTVKARIKIPNYIPENEKISLKCAVNADISNTENSIDTVTLEEDMTIEGKVELLDLSKCYVVTDYTPEEGEPFGFTYSGSQLTPQHYYVYTEYADGIYSGLCIRWDADTVKIAGYGDNIEPGYGTYTVVPVENSKFCEGSVTAQFEIKPPAIDYTVTSTSVGTITVRRSGSSHGATGYIIYGSLEDEEPEEMGRMSASQTTITLSKNIEQGEEYFIYVVPYLNGKDGAVIHANTETAKSVVVKKTFYIPSISAKAYTGKALTPVVVEDDEEETLRVNVDYTIRYSNNVNPGKATAVVTGKGDFAGTKTVTFNIVPKKATLSSVKKGSSRQLKVAWKKDSKATGYEVQYSLKSNFKSAKITKIKKNKTVKVTLKKLKAKKNYYVRVRAYKTISGKKCYGSWSKAKKCKTK